MKHLAYTSRDTGGTVGCFDGAVGSKLHTATSCHRVVPASSHTVTGTLHTEISRHHTVHSTHHTETASHGTAMAFLHTETSFHRAEKSFLHAAKSSGGITLAQKQAKNGQNRVFCRSNRKN